MPSSDIETIVVDKDLVTCPLTLERFRYPVITSDGRRYELGALLRYIRQFGLKSPLNRLPITFVAFDFLLESSLDKNPELERYNYDDKTLYPNGYSEQQKKADMEEIQNLIAEATLHHAMRKSGILSGTVGAVTFLLYTASLITNPTLIPCSAVISGFFDFETRYFTNYRFGVFGLTTRAIKVVSDSFQAHMDEQVDLYAEMLHPARRLMHN